MAHYKQIITLLWKHISIINSNVQTLQLLTFYTLPHDSGRVLWFHVGCPCVIMSFFLSLPVALFAPLFTSHSLFYCRTKGHYKSEKHFKQNRVYTLKRHIDIKEQIVWRQTDCLSTRHIDIKEQIVWRQTDCLSTYKDYFLVSYAFLCNGSEIWSW